MDKKRYQDIYKKLQEKYSDFPKTNQEIAFALAEVMHVKKSYVGNATPEMLWVMMRVIYAKDLNKAERMQLMNDITKFLYDTKTANYQLFGSSMRLNFKLVMQGKKNLDVSWMLDDEELEYMLQFCGGYGDAQLYLGSILTSEKAAVKLSSRYKELRRLFFNALAKRVALRGVSNGAMISIIIGTIAFNLKTDSICKNMQGEKSNRKKYWDTKV